jgi:acetyl-CoA carboxylase biotin carboxyl carrier protein
MDIRKIKKLIELLEETGVAEIEIKEGEESLRISRTGSQVQVVQTAPSLMPPAVQSAATAPAASAALAAAAPTTPASAAPTARTARAGEHVVTAPMVGTYYSAPAPGAKEFIAIGDEVKVGQVLCIIEAMKMMNQIESEYAGRIQAIMVKNNDPVEFSQPLFIIA